MLGWLLLSVLTALAALAALGVTTRAGAEGRAETGVVLTGVFFALLALPVLALGYAGALHRWTVAAASIATSGVALALSARGRAWREHARAIRGVAVGLARLPVDALVRAYRARSFALLGLAAAFFAILVSGALSWLAPSESWDGLFYHEPMVGFAIQNHGFSIVDLPKNMVVQCANGYPRLCEMIALWFVIFTDRSLIEIGNTLAAPGLMLAVYLLLKRQSPEGEVPAMGWSAVVLLLPAVLTQLRTSMIDVQVAFFLVAAIHFATRPVLRARDAVIGTLFLVLLAASKSASLVWAPPIALLLYGRLLVTARPLPRGRGIALASAGCLSIAGAFALTFARNWLAFRNPIWPVAYEIPWLHVSFRGLSTLRDLTHELPFAKLVELKYHRPIGGVADIVARDYGYGVPWVLVPAAALSMLGAVVVAARGRLSKRPDAAAERLLVLLGLGAVLLVLSPTLTNARFNVHLVVIAMASVAWAAGRMREGSRFHEGAIAATLALTLVPMFWTDWFFAQDAKGIVKLLQSPSEERASLYHWDFHMPRSTARAREREIGDDDLVMFTQESSFLGVLWNHRMSNRVEYIEWKERASLLAALEARGPKWVVVGANSGARAVLGSRPAEWEAVGTACKDDNTLAFRRRP